MSHRHTRKAQAKAIALDARVMQMTVLGSFVVLLLAVFSTI